MKLPLPPDIEFHKALRLLIHRARGVINREAVNRIITVIGELEHSLKEPFNRLLDTTEAEAVDLNFEYIRRVSLYRRHFYGNRPPIKTAILAAHPAMLDYGQLHATLTEGSPINVRVFQDRKETARWLGVPHELLAAKPSDSDKVFKERPSK